MKKLFQWVFAATVICGAMTFTACSSSDDGEKTDDNVLTVEKLAGWWIANYADNQTVGDVHWTRVVEDYMFSLDGTGYYEYYQTDGNRLVGAAMLRTTGKLHFTISGNTVAVTLDEMGITWKLNYADGKLTLVDGQSSMVYSKATAAQQAEIEQLYNEWKGANSGDDDENVFNLTGSIFLFWPAEVTIPDGWVVTGTLYRNCKINIAAGATVTLRNVNISCLCLLVEEDLAYPGLTCLGDATIILEGNNTVVGSITQLYTTQIGIDPGIYVPGGSTLTIKGTGSLKAECALYGQDSDDKFPMSPGIGIDGNLVIEGGHITANGGEHCPGIGNYGLKCGDITITGGTVIATGGKDAPAIGACSGTAENPISCGKITIGDNVHKVVVNAGAGCNLAMGFGNEYSTCGTITIFDMVFWDGTSFQNGGESYLASPSCTFEGSGK